MWALPRSVSFRLLMSMLAALSEVLGSTTMRRGPLRMDVYLDAVPNKIVGWLGEVGLFVFLFVVPLVICVVVFPRWYWDCVALLSPS